MKKDEIIAELRGQLEDSRKEVADLKNNMTAFVESHNQIMGKLMRAGLDIQIMGKNGTVTIDKTA